MILRSSRSCSRCSCWPAPAHRQRNPVQRARVRAVSHPVHFLRGGFIPNVKGLPGRSHLGPPPTTSFACVQAPGFAMFCCAVLKSYDEPVRAWLTARLSRRRRPAAQAEDVAGP